MAARAGSEHVEREVGTAGLMQPVAALIADEHGELLPAIPKLADHGHPSSVGEGAGMKVSTAVKPGAAKCSSSGLEQLDPFQ